MAEEEALSVFGGEDDEYRLHTEGNIRNAQMTQEEITSMKEQDAKLMESLRNEGESDRKRELMRLHWENVRSLYVRQDGSGDLPSYGETCFNKAKKSFYDCRGKIEVQMPRLARHLEDCVRPDGYSFIYRPHVEIVWSI